MKLTDISDVSISKIYACLAENRSVTSRFARTNYRFKKFADFRVNAEEIEFTYKKEKQLIRLFVSTGSEQGLAQEALVYHSPIPKMRLLAEKHLKMFNSSSNVTLNGFVINADFLILLRDILLPFTTCPKFVRLKLFDCEFECSEMKFFDTISYLKITKLFLVYPNLCKMKITSMHISQLSTILIHKEDSYNSDVDDQILTNWLYKTPKVVTFTSINTKITLDGLLKFLQEIAIRTECKRIPVSERCIQLGNIKTDENSQKQLGLAQRNPALTWIIKHDLAASRTFYTVSIQNISGYFKFNISTETSGKITKQQARDKIDALHSEIVEKQRLDPDYVAYTDEPIMDQINALRGGIYQEWIEIRDEILQLEMMGPDWLDDDSDGEDDSDED